MGLYDSSAQMIQQGSGYLGQAVQGYRKDHLSPFQVAMSKLMTGEWDARTAAAHANTGGMPQQPSGGMQGASPQGMPQAAPPQAAPQMPQQSENSRFVGGIMDSIRPDSRSAAGMPQELPPETQRYYAPENTFNGAMPNLDRGPMLDSQAAARRPATGGGIMGGASAMGRAPIPEPQDAEDFQSMLAVAPHMRQSRDYQRELEMRNAVQLEIANRNNAARENVAGANNVTKENVAGVQAGSRENAAKTRAGAALGVADKNAAASNYRANKMVEAARARVDAAERKYAARPQGKVGSDPLKAWLDLRKSYVTELGQLRGEEGKMLASGMVNPQELVAVRQDIAAIEEKLKGHDSSKPQPSSQPASSAAPVTGSSQAQAAGNQLPADRVGTPGFAPGKTFDGGRFVVNPDGKTYSPTR